MVTIRELYSEVKAVLKEADADTYQFDAKCIMECAFDSSLPQLLISAESEVDENILNNVKTMLKKRSEGYPLQYILGEWEFYGYPFKVGEGVLIPRPDTETIIDTILEKYSNKINNSPVIADLCSGTGCIAITLKRQIADADVTAIEFSDTALEFLRENALLNNAEIKIVKGDVLDEKTAEEFRNIDIIVSNPPYLTSDEMKSLQKEVSFEPEYALAGGDDGLDYYRKITSLWKNSLKDGGLLMYEIGMGQENALEKILIDNGFGNIIMTCDTAGIIRVLSAEKIQEE